MRSDQRPDGLGGLYWRFDALPRRWGGGRGWVRHTHGGVAENSLPRLVTKGSEVAQRLCTSWSRGPVGFCPALCLVRPRVHLTSMRFMPRSTIYGLVDCFGHICLVADAGVKIHTTRLCSAVASAWVAANVFRVGKVRPCPCKQKSGSSGMTGHGSTLQSPLLYRCLLAGWGWT